MVDEEIKRGVQMIQYQLITLMTTNGQAPFVTIYMYLNECRDEKTKADMVKIIREMFRQRIQGVKNEQESGYTGVPEAYLCIRRR